MTNLLTAIGSVVAAVAGLVAALRAVQVHRQVSTSNGDTLGATVEKAGKTLGDHIVNDEANFADARRSLAAIRTHLNIPPDAPGTPTPPVNPAS